MGTMMAKRPDDRYESVVAAVSALEAVVGPARQSLTNLPSAPAVIGASAASGVGSGPEYAPVAALPRVSIANIQSWLRSRAGRSGAATS